MRSACGAQRAAAGHEAAEVVDALFEPAHVAVARLAAEKSIVRRMTRCGHHVIIEVQRRVRKCNRRERRQSAQHTY